MESIFLPAPNNPVNNEPSVVNENWPHFTIDSDNNFDANSPFVPCILYSVREVSRFASRHFPKSVIIACCIFVGRPMIACYACSIVIFYSS